MLNVRFFIEDRILISCSARENKSIKIWNVYSGELLRTIQTNMMSGSKRSLVTGLTSLLVWNAGLEVCSQNRSVVYEDNAKCITIMKYDSDACTDEFISKQIKSIFK